MSTNKLYKEHIEERSKGLKKILEKHNYVIIGDIINCISVEYAAIGYNMSLSKGDIAFVITIGYLSNLTKSPPSKPSFTLISTITNTINGAILPAKLVNINITNDENVDITIERPNGVIDVISYFIRDRKIINKDILFVTNESKNLN